MAAGVKDKGIPTTFVVNADGRLAWIGHPSALEVVLRKIVNGTWDIQKELATQNENNRLAALDDSLRWELVRYSGDYYKQDYIGKPDSALLMINEIVRKEPKLKYAPYMADFTFSSMLKTNPYKAYEYGKLVIVTPTYEEPAYSVIINDISYYSDKLNLPAEIYGLGAEAYQIEIDQLTYPELVDLPRYYYRMAVWYGKAKNKSKAIDAIQRAIQELKNEKSFSKRDMSAFELLLQQYEKM